MQDQGRTGGGWDAGWMQVVGGGACLFVSVNAWVFRFFPLLFLGTASKYHNYGLSCGNINNCRLLLLKYYLVHYLVLLQYLLLLLLYKTRYFRNGSGGNNEEARHYLFLDRANSREKRGIGGFFGSNFSGGSGGYCIIGL